MKILTIVGARPQFIKAASVGRAIAARSEISHLLVHTGQHYDFNMSQVLFDELELPEPDHYLGVGSGSHGAQTAAMLQSIETVLQDEKPDWVLIYGDTNSTLAGALAAVKLHIKIAHVEAGLRSFNMHMPEEVNRLVADRVSDLLFAPTETAVKILKAEGYADEAIELVGDVMYDVALHYAPIAEQRSKALTQYEVTAGDYILATVHRAENTDDPARLTAIFEALSELSNKHSIVLPLHPRTKACLEAQSIEVAGTPNLRITEPLGYLDIVTLEKNAKLVLTDSGGVQKEAFFYDVPCATLRDETEWTELVDAGWNTLVPPKSGKVIVSAVEKILSAGAPQTKPDALYGDGAASQKIVDRLLANT